MFLIINEVPLVRRLTSLCNFSPSELPVPISCPVFFPVGSFAFSFLTLSSYYILDITVLSIICVVTSFSYCVLSLCFEVHFSEEDTESERATLNGLPRAVCWLPDPVSLCRVSRLCPPLAHPVQGNLWNWTDTWEWAKLVSSCRSGGGGETHAGGSCSAMLLPFDLPSVSQWKNSLTCPQLTLPEDLLL